ncbi:MAG: ABC transporter substrate-binding protein [Gammaproteobacteria bacterium]|nr:ABC transporter substrate-binding protein [Gammaproteobacteria bacterium]MDH5693715.1 ABC transporter substrate-binding protein [Gammaproteobacteria bacterium]
MNRKYLSTLTGVAVAAVIATSGIANAADDNSLRYGEFGRPATLDPVTSNDMISLRVTELLFNGLVGINEKQQIIPELASKWSSDSEGKEYTFELRKDVKWHPKPGKEPELFTADDVVYTFNMMMHPKTITPLKVRYEFIEKVEKVDDNTVKFVLKRPILNALAKFTFKIIPEHGPKNPVFLTREDPFVQSPIGTGPYMLKEVNSDREVILAANPDYFRGKPQISEFVAKPFADQNIMNQALTFNAIDMIVLVNPRHLPELQGDKRFVLQPYNALSYSFFGYNVRHPHLQDKRVRKALTMAIDREKMLKSFFNDQGTLISGPFAPGSWAYNLDVKPEKFNPDEAVALLKEAGFTQGAGGIMTKNGQPLKLTLKVPIAKESESIKRVVLAFKGYLKRVGADINVEFQEWLAWKDDVFQKHNFDVVFASWVFDDSADISSLFHSAEVGAWKNNFGGYENRKVDSLIAESKLTLDHEKRRSIYRKLHAVLADEAPYTFLWTLTNYSAYHKKMRKVAIHPYKFFSFADQWFIAKDVAMTDQN